MRLSPVMQPDRNFGLARALPIRDESPLTVPTPPKTSPLLPHTTPRRSTICATPSDNQANLSSAAKQLESCTSTYSLNDSNDPWLRSYTSTESEDPASTTGRHTRRAQQTPSVSRANNSTSVFITTSSGYNALTSTSTATASARSHYLVVADDNLSSSFTGDRNTSNAPSRQPTPRRSSAVGRRSSSPAGIALHRRRRAPSSSRGNRGLDAVASTARSAHARRPHKDIELSQHLCPAPPAPTLRATEAVPPIAVEFDGARCCPLLRRYLDKSAAPPAFSARNEGDINLSPFKTWDFTRFLPELTTTTTSNHHHRGSSNVNGKHRRSKKPATRNTLCLDLDETLVHTSLVDMPDADAVVSVCPTGNDARASYDLYVKYRPHLREFMAFCLANFEVVIFTASKKYYASAILARLQADLGDMFTFYVPEDVEEAEGEGEGEQVKDTNSNGGEDGKSSGGSRPRRRRAAAENEMVLLHRDHCTPTNAGFVKDLFLLGRDLRRCFIIDNNVCCGSFQPFNFLHVKDYARKEKELSQLMAVNAHKSGDAASARAAALNQLRLKKLKGFNVTGVSEAGELEDGAAECTLTSESSCLWEDPNDDVLLRLIAPSVAALEQRKFAGVLVDMATSKDIPADLLASMMMSRALENRASRSP